MSEVRVSKEKNIITMEIPCGERFRTYYLDISTGDFITKTGRVAKYPCSHSALRKSLWGLCSVYFFNTHELKIFSAVELLLSEGFLEQDIWCYMGSRWAESIARTFTHLMQYKKHFHQWVKNNGNAVLNDNFLALFVKYAIYRDGQSQRGFYGKQISLEQFNFIRKYDPTPSLDDLEIYGYYIQRNNYYFELAKEAYELVFFYLDRCKFLKKTPQKCADMFREFAETERTYKILKEKIDNEKFRANLQKHSEAWDFSFGDFTIVVPKEGQDLAREGLEMHHCVGLYVNDVAEGITNIVFVRRKSAPEECYITCQVCNNGRIGQYYLAYDRDISSEEDKEFKRAFQEHLNKVWNNN